MVFLQRKPFWEQSIALNRFPRIRPAKNILPIFASVTASSSTAISTNFATSTCSENFVKNSFKFDVALKHAQDEVPARKAPQKKQKSPLATNKHRRRLKRRPRHIQNTVLCQSLGDIHYYSKGNQCSRCSLEYPCGILCGN